MTRQVRVRDAKPAKFIAYDLETTNIAVGTPRPLYLTAYSRSPEFSIDCEISSMEHLRDLLVSRFLIREHIGAKFVAWNANNFDVYFIAACILQSDEYVIRPYLTKGNQVRGLKIIVKGDEEKEQNSQKSWEFLDGMAMLGLAGVSLEKFLNIFAPDYGKMVGVIDFSKEGFDPKNPKHRMYAYRDSQGLYYAMVKAQEILLQVFNQPLTVTMGNACIKIFKAHIPKDIIVKNLPDKALDVIRQFVMRGGFCYIARRYHGKVWKYDLNQAYAAAMREAWLPAGDAYHTEQGLARFAKVFIARVTAINAQNKIPMYVRTFDGARVRSEFAYTEIRNTWLTSIEYNQLKNEGWKIEVHESWYWSDRFSMRDYVDKLERIRTTCEGGASGAIGTMIKAVGNHSYGKTVEQLEDIEFLLAKDCPQGFEPYYGEDISDAIQHVYFRFTDPRDKDYHQPHIGAFITAHVRMVVRRAALLNPDAWLYADTDCVVFSHDVTSQLDVDPKRYGAWKIEEQGTEYRIIAKKVYQNVQTGKGNAKGLNVKRLSPEDFERWFDGNAPEQDQVQRNNFVKVMAGAEMFRLQTRKGTSVEINQ